MQIKTLIENNKCLSKKKISYPHFLLIMNTEFSYHGFNHPGCLESLKIVE